MLRAEVHLLAPTGERHHAQPHRLTLPGAMVGALAHVPAEKLTSVRGAEMAPLEVALSLSAREIARHEYEIVFRVQNLTVASSGLDRAGALARSLISTHPVLTVAGGRFVSPLEQFCGSVNTFPVLAANDDSAVVGAAIMLPDHPQIAPESQGGLFDSTEIEEALLLHLQVLSDAERCRDRRTGSGGARDARPCRRRLLAGHPRSAWPGHRFRSGAGAGRAPPRDDRAAARAAGPDRPP